MTDAENTRDQNPEDAEKPVSVACPQAPSAQTPEPQAASAANLPQGSPANQSGPERQPQSRKSVGVYVLFKVLLRSIRSMGSDVKTCLQEFAKLLAEIQRLKTDDRVLTELSQRCRELTEQHYEREFLTPVFLTLIGILDRACQQIVNLEGFHKTAGNSNTPAVLAIRYLLESRVADRVEIENLLANYAVEPFQSPDDKFDPTCQKCISQQPCADTTLHGCIAQRLLPGYRRYGKVLRRECISIYISEKKENPFHKGEQNVRI